MCGNIFQESNILNFGIIFNREQDKLYASQNTVPPAYNDNFELGQNICSKKKQFQQYL